MSERCGRCGSRLLPDGFCANDCKGERFAAGAARDGAEWEYEAPDDPALDATVPEVLCTCITAHDRAVCVGWCKRPAPALAPDDLGYYEALGELVERAPIPAAPALDGERCARDYCHGTRDDAARHGYGAGAHDFVPQQPAPAPACIDCGKRLGPGGEEKVFTACEACWASPPPPTAPLELNSRCTDHRFRDGGCEICAAPAPAGPPKPPPGEVCLCKVCREEGRPCLPVSPLDDGICNRCSFHREQAAEKASKPTPGDGECKTCGCIEGMHEALETMSAALVASNDQLRAAVAVRSKAVQEEATKASQYMDENDQLRERLAAATALLREAIGWLGDPSAYWSRGDMNDFDQRIDAFLNTPAPKGGL